MKSEKIGKESFNRSNIRQDLEEGNGKIYPEYEASKIEDTRNSLLWAWRRVREFYKDVEGVYNNKNIQRIVYELKYS